MKHIDLSQVTSDNVCGEGTSGDETSQACFMVQEIDSLEVKSDTQLDDIASPSCDDNSMDANALNEELSFVGPKAHHFSFDDD